MGRVDGDAYADAGLNAEAAADNSPRGVFDLAYALTYSMTGSS